MGRVTSPAATTPLILKKSYFEQKYWNSLFSGWCQRCCWVAREEKGHLFVFPNDVSTWACVNEDAVWVNGWTGQRVNGWTGQRVKGWRVERVNGWRVNGWVEKRDTVHLTFMLHQNVFKHITSWNVSVMRSETSVGSALSVTNANLEQRYLSAVVGQRAFLWTRRASPVSSLMTSDLSWLGLN